MALLIALNGEGQTIIMVTHNPGVTRFASRTIHVKDGLVFLDEVRGNN